MKRRIIEPEPDNGAFVMWLSIALALVSVAAFIVNVKLLLKVIG